MKNFKSGGRSNDRDRAFGGKGGFSGGSKGGFGGRSSFGGDSRGGSSYGGRSDRPERRESTAEMFSATCTACGKACEVPFKPTGDRPVFCRDCFGKQNEGGREAGPRREVSRDDRPTTRAEHAPTYVAARPDNSLNDIKRQLTALESKLNRILDLINPPMPAKAKTESVAVVTSAIAETPKTEKIRKPKIEVKKAAVKKVAAKKAVTKKAAK